MACLKPSMLSGDMRAAISTPPTVNCRPKYSATALQAR
jgi:hypothetical protein